MLTTTRFGKVRWAPGLPADENHYFDEPINIKHRMRKNSDKRFFPPSSIDLSDAWVVKMIESDLTGIERSQIYPAVFRLNGSLRKNYEHKGRAAKVFSEEANCWVYKVAYNRIQLFGAEGWENRLSPAIDKGPVTIKSIIQYGDPCLVQSDDYIPQSPPRMRNHKPVPIRSLPGISETNKTTHRGTQDESTRLFEPGGGNESSTTTEIFELSGLSHDSARRTDSANNLESVIKDNDSGNRLTKRKRDDATGPDQDRPKRFKYHNTDSASELTAQPPGYIDMRVDDDAECSDSRLLHYEDPICDARHDRDTLEGKIAALESKLALAEKKFVKLVMVTESVHGALHSLLKQLKTAHGLLSTVEDSVMTVRRPTNEKVAVAWDKDVKAVRTFTEENGSVTRAVIESCNRRLRDVGKTMPNLYSRIVSHGDDGKTPPALRAWALEETEAGSKLFDD